MEIFFSLRLTWFRAHGLDRNSRDCISYYNRKRRSWNSHTVLFPVVTARMGLQRSEKCHKLKGLRDVKEGGTCIELEKQAYCGDWEWRNQHCRSDWILGFHSGEKAEIKMETFYYRKSRIWEMKEDKYRKSLAKNQVSAIVHMRDIRKNVSPKFITLCMETPCLCPIWPPETNRNMCFWVFLRIREFLAWGTHKD